MDGGFHFKTTTYQTIEETQEIDRIKEEFAKEHDIEVIRIDCRKSEAEYIIENILKSKLNEIFDLSNINWDVCRICAVSNLVEKACKYYQKYKFEYTLREIAEHFNISLCTLQRYRKYGYSVGWCNDTEEDKKVIRSLCIKRHDSYPINVYDVNHKLIKSFHSVPLCSKYMNHVYNIDTSIRSIIDHCDSPGKIYKGYYFEYAKNDVNN